MAGCSECLPQVHWNFIYMVQIDSNCVELWHILRFVKGVFYLVYILNNKMATQDCSSRSNLLKKLLTSPRESQEVTKKIYLSQKSQRNHLKRNFSPNNRTSTSIRQVEHLKFDNLLRGGEKVLLSDRKNTVKELYGSTSTSKNHKFFKSKLNSSTSRLDKISEKSTIISTMLSARVNRINRFKEERKLYEQGKNCRIVVIEAQEELELFVHVEIMKDLIEALKKEFPRTVCFKSVPTQITMDYLLMQPNIVGNFLNGQSLYLKPWGRTSSLCEKERVSLNSFEVIKMIGSGGFSKVFLCRFKENGEFYAMKVIDKELIVKNKKKKIIMNQRNIMKDAKHPFLIEMKFSFETDLHLIFIMEYCPGGELFGLIKKYKRINEDTARFYIIEIFLGLSYLHQSQVVYRDIKPENILLGQDGHVKIADLGLAKPNMFEGQMAYSFCGSPEYMSPEMILQVGHSYPVDFYCMGALLYELLIGLPPFYSRDTNEIYESVLSQELTFPEDLSLSSECKSLLKGLLCKESKQRLGSIHGVKQILAHPWFGKNAYKSFIDKQITPPITFDSVSRIDLDKQADEKGRKDYEQLLRAQKHENKRFKPVMKNFYHDFRGLTEIYSENKENVSYSKRRGARSSSRDGSLRITKRMSQKVSKLQ